MTAHNIDAIEVSQPGDDAHWQHSEAGGVWGKAIAVKDGGSYDGLVAKDMSYYKLTRLP